MPRRLLVAVALAAYVLPAFAAGGRARTSLCKQSCATAIAGCVAEGGRPRKCKRLVLRRCKREGVTACLPPLTYAVDPAGADGPTCGTPEAPCRTIQFVVDALVPPEGAGTIKVGAGTFAERTVCPTNDTYNEAVVCIMNRQIVLLGGFVPPNWDTPSGDPATTVIDGGGRGRGVRVVRGSPGAASSLVMEGFTIQHGLAEGAADGDLTLISAFGGGLYAQHTPLTLRNVVFRDNEARGSAAGQAQGGRGAGGALAVYNGWPTVPAPAVLEQVTFERNHAAGGVGASMGGYALGGALFTHAIPLTGDGLVFTANTATAGATAGSGRDGAEKGDALGGAVAVSTDGVVELRHVVATGNVATGGAAPGGEGGGAFGGALYAEQGSLTVSDATIAGNLAQGGVGANPAPTGSLAQGGGVQAVTSTLVLERTRVVDNTTRSGDGAEYGGVSEGGGVAVILGRFGGVDRPFTLRNTVVADNLVTVGAGRLVIGAGGGLFVNGAEGLIEHSTIADNRLDDEQFAGGGIALLPVPGWTTHLTVRDSILANHRTVGIHPRTYSTAAIFAAEGTSVDVARVLFANNLYDTNAGRDDPYNLPPGSYTLADVTVAGDAGFVAAGAPDRDYRLLGTSPALDLAVGSAVAQDLDGTLRPQGAAPDLGAYERVP